MAVYSTRRHFLRASAGAAIALGVGSRGQYAAGRDRCTVYPVEDLSILNNPDKGWILYFYDNSAPAKEGESWSYGERIRPGEPVVFPGLGMAYFRLAWAYLEPEEGVYDWSLIDPWHQQFAEQGLRIGFRITAFECRDIAYATPKWVEDAGAVFHSSDEYGYAHDVGSWHPQWDDPVFLEKLDNFLGAFAERYDGDPDVAWIDIGSLGIWGEGNLGESSLDTEPLDVYKRHIDLHDRHFQDTLLVVNDDFGEAAVRYAAGLGMTVRDDSLCVYPGRPYMSEHMAEWFWRERPVILETCHYGGSVDRGAWDRDAVMRAVKEYKATWLSIHYWHGEFLEQEADLIDQVTNRLGYWLFVKEATLPVMLSPGDSFLVEIQWENRGVAPLYQNYAVSLALSTEDNDIIWSAADDAYDLRRLMPEAQMRTFHSHTLPTEMAPGDYVLAVGLSRRTEPIAPEIALAIKGRDAKRWHPLHEIQVITRNG